MRKKNEELMKKIIDFVDERYEEKGRTPSYREIAGKFSTTSACISNYIKEMKERNMIDVASGSRGLITKKMKEKPEIVRIPVLGRIACGEPLLAEANIEDYISLPREILGNGEFFILQANGESMINAGIDDGDYVIVRIQPNAEEGQIISALIDDEATLKRYYIDRKRRKVRLHPENDNMEDMYFKDVEIQGVAIKVIKDL